MPIKETSTAYPLIDADPYFGRVVRYMRPSDVAFVAGGAAFAPSLLYAWGSFCSLVSLWTFQTPHEMSMFIL